VFYNFFLLLHFYNHSRYIKRVISKRDGCEYLKQVPYNWSYFTTDVQSVSQYVLVSGTPLGPMTTIYFFLFVCRNIALFFDLVHPLWRENWSVICCAFCQWSESRRTHNHTLLSHLRVLGSLSVASYHSQGLRFTYSYPPPRGEFWGLGSRYDWQSVSMSWRRAHLGTCDQILILSECCCLVSVGRPFWREVRSVSCQSVSAIIVHRQVLAFFVLFSGSFTKWKVFIYCDVTISASS
jgi:hypothetical protein